MIKEVEGIIIHTTNYSENSKILNIFTKEYGIIGVISKGCRNVKSKLKNVSENFIYGKFNIYYKENKLSTLISCDIINYLKNTKNDITLIGYLTYLCELSSQVYKQNEQEDIYNILIDSIIKIEDGFNPKVITNIVEVKYLDYLGVSLNLNNCVVCGSNNIVTISSISGGYVCKDHVKNERIIEPKVLKMFRLYYYVDISKISELKIENSTINEINSFLTDYYENFTGLYLKSKKFLNEVTKK